MSTSITDVDKVQIVGSDKTTVWDPAAATLPIGVSTSANQTNGSQLSGPVAGATVDRSALLTTAGTAQTLAALNASRKFLSLENLDTTNGLWYSLVGTAAASTIGSRYLGPGDSAALMIGSFVPKDALSVVGTVANQKCTVWEG